jgi:carbon monoxide dehydrogenase subunit G
MNVEYTNEFECPPEVLWGYLEEPAKMRAWMKGLEAVEYDSGRPGSTATLRIKEGKKVATYRSTVATREPYSRLSVAISGGSFGEKSMLVDYTLTDLGGRTRLDYRCAMQCPSVLMRIVGFVFGPLIRKQFTIASGRYRSTQSRGSEGTTRSDQPNERTIQPTRRRGSAPCSLSVASLIDPSRLASL